MNMHVEPGTVGGAVTIPGSKSHTIRGLVLGLLADGESLLHAPLRSSDTESCLSTVRALGARVDDSSDGPWRIEGTAGRPAAPAQPVDVGNSGTTLYLAMSAAALADGETEFTGDEQTQRRPATKLIDALRALGATTCCRRNNGCVPLAVAGPLRGGHISIECPTSQYLSSLLIACPLAEGDTIIDVPLLNEHPYVRMTLDWVRAAGGEIEAADDLSRFEIAGGQRYRAFDRAVAADFSSATFFLVAAAVTGSELLLRGLDMSDTQGDKAVVGMLKQMGCTVIQERDGLRMRGPERLVGAEFDLNATPDALPAMAVAGAVAEGETRLVNIPQAREKETDRLAVMAAELARMGADVDELTDGLVIRGGRLQGTAVDGHSDHRVVMALAVAGLAADGPVSISTAEAVSITFPTFSTLMRDAGARIDVRR